MGAAKVPQDLQLVIEFQLSMMSGLSKSLVHAVLGVSGFRASSSRWTSWSDCVRIPTETTCLYSTGAGVGSCAEAVRRHTCFSKSQVIRSLLLRGSGTAARFVINAISTEPWRCLVGTELGTTFSHTRVLVRSSCLPREVAEAPSNRTCS